MTDFFSFSTFAIWLFFPTLWRNEYQIFFKTGNKYEKKTLKQQYYFHAMFLTTTAGPQQSICLLDAC